MLHLNQELSWPQLLAMESRYSYHCNKTEPTSHHSLFIPPMTINYYYEVLLISNSPATNYMEALLYSYSHANLKKTTFSSRSLSFSPQSLFCKS